jgi:hypothetical protein
MAVVESRTSPHPSPWAWGDYEGSHFTRAGGPVSPQIRGQDLDAHASFLRPMESFRLSGEDESPLHQPPSDRVALPVAWQPQPAPAPPPASRSIPLTRQRSGAEQMAMFVEEAFDEMDEVLARQGHPPPHTAFAPQVDIYGRPSAEEQAWLDQVRVTAPATLIPHSVPTTLCRAGVVRSRRVAARRVRWYGHGGCACSRHTLANRAHPLFPRPLLSPYGRAI